MASVLTGIRFRKGVDPLHYTFGFSTIPDVKGVTTWFTYVERPTLTEGTYYVFMRHYLTGEIKSIKAFSLNCNGSLELCSLVYGGIKPIVVNNACVLSYAGLIRANGCILSYAGLSKVATDSGARPGVDTPVEDSTTVSPSVPNTVDIYAKPAIRGVNTCNPLSDNAGVGQLRWQWNDDKTMWMPLVDRGSTEPGLQLYFVVSGRGNNGRPDRVFWTVSEVEKFLFPPMFVATFRGYLMRPGNPSTDQRHDDGRNFQQLICIQ